MVKIKVIDACCGVGKTTAIINHINESSYTNKFMYITPILSEVSRIERACEGKKFVQPDDKPTKTIDLLRLIEGGRNICSTHSLFRKLTNEVLDYDKLKDYTLIIDETANVVEEIDISKDDLKMIIEHYAKINEDRSLTWYAKDYEGRFEDYKNMIEMGGVMAHLSASNKVISLVWMFPIKIFEAFKEIYILTYLFNGQKVYYDYCGFEIQNLYVRDEHLTSTPQKYDYSKQKALISVCENPHLNEIGEAKGALSLSWYNKNKKGEAIERLKRNTYNFFKHNAKSASSKNLWTTFKDYEPILKGKGYTTAFLPINAKATNEYKNRDAVAYLANRYMKPTLKHFFETYGLEIDEDAYALSELIQFVYRSAIRDGKPIIIYIPSKRMRTLFKEWLEKKDE